MGHELTMSRWLLPTDYDPRRCGMGPPHKARPYFSATAARLKEITTRGRHEGLASVLERRADSKRDRYPKASAMNITSAILR